MAKRGRLWQAALIGVLVLHLALPLHAWSAIMSVGTARGIRAVELSLDGGKSWLAVGGESFPVMEGSRLRSAAGGALLDLADGSRVNLLPFSALSVREAGGATEIFLQYGRVTFRLPDTSRVAIVTPIARLEPNRSEIMVGEVVADGRETVGVKMAKGHLQVTDLRGGGQRVRVASREPIFLPRPPATAGPVFSSDLRSSPPADAPAVFNATGESLGYLRPDSRLVIHPSYTADLTGPFSSTTVQVALAEIPAEDRQTATPLFDVDGRYVGYVAGAVFYPYPQIQLVQAAAASGSAAARVRTRTLVLVFLGLGAVAGLAVGLAAAFDGDGAAPAATPVSP